MIEIRGAEQLAALSKRLKAVADRELKKEFSKGIADAMNPLKAEVKRSALATLPSRGGLAARVAKSNLRINRSGTRIALTAKNAYEIRRMNAGVVRHPVYGNRNTWVSQSVQPGWFDRPTKAAEQQIRKQLETVMNRIAAKI